MPHSARIMPPAPTSSSLSGLEHTAKATTVPIRHTSTMAVSCIASGRVNDIRMPYR